MYELNENLKVQIEPFQDSFIYTIDNFFKDPNKILSFMKTAPHTMWQGFTSPNHNGKYYKYKKIFHNDNQIQPVIDLMMPHFKVGEIQFRGFILSDYYLFNNEYNDYQNKYFWPHKDFGWTGVVYLNDYEGPGTNIYNEKQNVIRDNLVVSGSESAWFDKNLYTLEKALMSKFNTCVFFDAFKFYHNMAVDDRSWFNEHRYNVVMHFKHGDIKFYNHEL